MICLSMCNCLQLSIEQLQSYEVSNFKNRSKFAFKHGGFLRKQSQLLLHNYANGNVLPVHLTILYDGYYSYTGNHQVTQITQLLMAGSTFIDSLFVINRGVNKRC